jgi:hypothetical protein
MGKDGQPVHIVSNYFEFITKPNSKLFQYRVDLSVEEDRTRVKKAIVYRVKDQLPTYLFDGT